MKKVTLSDIAARLGISKYSVSRALSGRDGVGEATRREVMETARAMGYRHAALARGPAGTARPSVILLIPYQDVEDAEFWMGLISGASRQADALGYTFVTRPMERHQPHEPANMDDVAGVIVAGSRARPAWRPYREAGIPATLATYATPLEAFDTVHAADREGGMAVARHLIDLGHTRLAFVSEAFDKPSFAARARGFREVAEAAPEVTIEDIAIDAEAPGASFQEAYRARAGRGAGPTGVLASTDGIAFAVASALGRLGLQVPGDVSVVGVNDAAGSARFVPRLTTLHIPTFALGRAAMQFLHERIEGADGAPRRLELAPTFVARDSTAPPRAAAIELPADVVET